MQRNYSIRFLYPEVPYNCYKGSQFGLLNLKVLFERPRFMEKKGLSIVKSILDAKQKQYFYSFSGFSGVLAKSPLTFSHFPSLFDGPRK